MVATVSKSKRLAGAALTAMVIASCGPIARPSTAAMGVLAGKSPRALASMAQTYVRGGHYRFSEVASQTSTGTGLAGLPAPFLLAANGHGTWTSTGDVQGTRQIGVTAVFNGGDSVYAAELGCRGYASTDSNNWSSGSDERTLARLLTPDIDDATVSGTNWQDFGETIVAGVRMHHLQAAVTAQSLQASAPASGATPPPGVSVAPTTQDIWMRSSDGSVARMTLTINVTSDMTALRSAQHPDVAGEIHSVITEDARLKPLAVQHMGAPPVSLTSDPVAPSVFAAFGVFGVQVDSCPQSVQPATIQTDAPPDCGTVVEPGMPAATVAYVTALHEESGKQALISASIASGHGKPSLLDLQTQISADHTFVSEVTRIRFAGTVLADAEAFTSAINAYDALIRDALAIQTPAWFSGYNKYGSALNEAVNLRHAISAQLRADLGLPASSTCAFFYP
jgi:hypothetical protein